MKNCCQILYSMDLLTHTIVNQRISVSEINKSRICFNAISFGEWNVLYFNEINSIYLTIVVNIFQLIQYYITGSTIWLIYEDKGLLDEIANHIHENFMTIN